MAQQIITEQGAFTADVADKINDNFTELFGSGSGDVAGPASAVNNNLATFDGTSGKTIKDSGQTITQVIAAAVASAQSGGASAGPFTTITSITVVNGIVTNLQGS